MKQNLSSEKKRKRTPKEPWEPKSKDKQIMSDKPKKSSGKGKRTRVCDIYNNAEDQYMCLERAGMLLERLDAELPKFAKCMLPSNVLYSFWLILPKNFCVMHLPEHDTTVTLVDESGKEFKTNYLKVHIVRRYGLEAIEAAICLMEMHPRVKRTRAPNSEKPKLEKAKKGKRTQRSRRKRIERLPPNRRSTRGDTEEDGDWASDLDSNLLDDRCDNSSDAFSSEVLEGSSTKMSTQLQASEHGCCGLNLCYHEGIDCGSTTRRIYSSTVAT